MVLSAGNKLKVFQLLFSDPGRSFYSSGDKLSGSVQLEAAQPCRVAALRVSAAGCARVDYRSGKQRKSRSQEVEYLKYEEELRLEEALTRGAGQNKTVNAVYCHKETMNQFKLMESQQSPSARCDNSLRL